MTEHPFKVAHVMRRFSETHWGGTESVIHNLSAQLIERGYDAKVFCTDMLSKPGLEVVQGVPISRHAYCFPWWRLSLDAMKKMELKGGNPWSWSLLRALWLEEGVSLIHTHVQHRLGGIARTVARCKGIPYVASVHGGYFTLPEEQAQKMQQPFKGHWEWGKPLGWLLGARRVLQDADAIVCVGRDEFGKMREAFPQKHVFYIPNGLNIAQFTEGKGQLFREQFGLENQPYILSVSRIETQKNQLLLVRAFAEFAERYPDYQLVLIGPVAMEDYYQQLRAAIAALVLKERVVLIPGLSPNDPLLASAYKGAAIFALTSHNEPFGIVILEAWAAGAPVIASRVGGIPGFTHDGEDILLFADDDEATLVAHLKQLASDNALRHRLITAGREQVKRYDWAQIADKWLEAYQVVCGRGL